MQGVPVLALDKRMRPRKVSYGELFTANTEDLDLRPTFAHLQRLLGRNRIEGMQLFNVNVKDMQQSVRDDMIQGNFGLAVEKMNYMLEVNGRFRSDGTPGHSVKDTFTGVLMKATIIESRERRKFYEKQRLLSIQSLGLAPPDQKDVKKYQIPKMNRLKLLVELFKIFSEKVKAFVLVKYKKKEYMNMAYSSLRKYFDIRTRYGLISTTPAIFCNFIYVGSPIFVSLTPAECAEKIRIILKGRCDPCLYELAAPRPIYSYKFPRVGKDGIIQIRYKSFTDAMKAYSAFIRSVLWQRA